MNLTKIGMWNDISIPLYKIELQNLEDKQGVHIILVPDKETYHEVTGLALLYNKAVFVHLLEPGNPLEWESTLPSPWHVNTDKYHLTFTTGPTIHTPHLLFNCL
jgi:hypothetical protein